MATLGPDMLVSWVVVATVGSLVVVVVVVLGAGVGAVVDPAVGAGSPFILLLAEPFSLAAAAVADDDDFVLLPAA